MYGTGFTAGSLPGKGARDGMRGTGNKVSFEKELMEVGRMGAGKKVVSGGTR